MCLRRGYSCIVPKIPRTFIHSHLQQRNVAWAHSQLTLGCCVCRKGSSACARVCSRRKLFVKLDMVVGTCTRTRRTAARRRTNLAKQGWAYLFRVRRLRRCHSSFSGRRRRRIWMVAPTSSPLSSFPMHARMHGGGGRGWIVCLLGRICFSTARNGGGGVCVCAGRRRRRSREWGRGDWREDEPGTKEGSSPSVRPRGRRAVSDVHDASKRFRGGQGQCFYAFGLGRL